MSLKINREYDCAEDMKNPLLNKIVGYINEVDNLSYYMGISNGEFYVAKHIEKIVLDHYGIKET